MFIVTGLILIVFTQCAPVSPVTMAPLVNVTMEHVTVVEGGRVILPCTVDMEDQSVIWVNPRKILISFSQNRMIDDHRISVERPYIKVWNLLIRTVRYNDSGTYECRVNTTPRQIKKVRLEVQVPPSILSQLSSDKVILQEGETATIVCNVTGIPTPNVTWYKRNYRIIGGSKERIGKEGEVLMIKNITRHCDDIYECFVDNGVPPAVSKAIRVVVYFPPEVVLPDPKRIGQRLHKETILECEIHGNPLGDTKWKRNGKELQNNNNYDKYDIDVIHNDLEDFITLALRIRKLEKEDYGAYECVGSNFLGEDKETMILYETKPPKTTTTTTTTTPAIIHVPSGQQGHGGNGDSVLKEDRHPQTNRHRQGHVDDDDIGGDDGNSESGYNYGRVKGDSDGHDRDGGREWERHRQTDQGDTGSDHENSQGTESWSAFESGNVCVRVKSSASFSILLAFIAYFVTK